jgi:hypothetical protein
LMAMVMVMMTNNFEAFVFTIAGVRQSPLPVNRGVFAVSGAER